MQRVIEKYMKNVCQIKRDYWKREEGGESRFIMLLLLIKLRMA
jgi:hypothetical protein